MDLALERPAGPATDDVTADGGVRGDTAEEDVDAFGSDSGEALVGLR